MGLLAADTSYLLFFGRFHPLVVHLPIGFLLLAMVFEILSYRKKAALDEAIAYALLLGAGSGVASVLFGLMLASDGGYQASSLQVHKWMGIITTLIAGIVYVLKVKSVSSPGISRAYRVGLFLLLPGLLGTGHYGGNLTHGSDYLFEHAPEPVRKLAGLKPQRIRITSLDSALVFDDMVVPILEEKCTACHNADKKKGELQLTDRASMMAGGENGAVFEPGTPSKSELIRRITLSPTHDDFMPSEGRTPLIDEETKLLIWWIEQGAPFEGKIQELAPNEETLGWLRAVGIGAQTSFLASRQVADLAPSDREMLKESGFTVDVIAGGKAWLEVSYSPYAQESLTHEKLQLLTVAAEQITWLNLSGTPLKADWLAVLPDLPHLTRLRLDRTECTDDALAFIRNLEHLEYLNLFGTSVTDQSLEIIAQMPSLKSLYLWQTRVTESGIAALKQARPDLDVVSGIE
ncbi:MAG: hypothetical protein OEY56_03165 [Cyclobacteriaceae bacterium]|nr:hypothetical protein [Cyclobacteriaceae bacterium]